MGSGDHWRVWRAPSAGTLPTPPPSPSCRCDNNDRGCCYWKAGRLLLSSSETVAIRGVRRNVVRSRYYVQYHYIEKKKKKRLCDMMHSRVQKPSIGGHRGYSSSRHRLHHHHHINITISSSYGLGCRSHIRPQQRTTTPSTWPLSQMIMGLLKHQHYLEHKHVLTNIP